MVNVKAWRGLGLLAGLGVLASCAAYKPAVGPPIDLGTYTVMKPEGKNWRSEIHREEHAVDFAEPIRFGRSPAGDLWIRVYQNEVHEEKRQWSASEVADDYRKLEHEIMLREGVEGGHYRIEDLKMGSEEINGATFYTMSYLLKAESSPWGIWNTSDAKLFIYFPPDFAESHRFFCFLAQKAYMGDGLAKGSLADVYAVIESFVVK